MCAEKLVPKLRFNGFDEEWHQSRFEDIYDIKNGLNKGKEYFGKGIQILNYMDVNKYELNTENTIEGLVELSDEEIERYSVKPNDLFFTRTSETSDEIGLTSAYIGNPIKCVFSGFLLRARPKVDLNSLFFAYYLRTPKQRNNIIKFSSITTRALISGGNLAKMKINLPSIDEQNKIANLFVIIDKKVKLLEKKYQEYQDFKKYLMQQIFAQKLRFNFDEEWKRVKLKDIVERVTRKNTKLETDLALTISAEYGLIDQEEFFNKIVASKSLKNYYLIKNGEFAYNKSYSNGYPYGAIKRLDDYPLGALSTLYICFKPTNVNSDYLKEYFETTFWYKEIYSIAVEGARNHGLLNINVNDFFNTKHLIPPSKEEQKKIADFFKSINSKIDAVNNDLNLVKNFKKGLLQQMFI